jgi:hypothetical protein
MRERLQQAVHNYEDTQRRRMRLQRDEVDALIEAMTAVQRLRPPRVVVRGCNLGQNEVSMTALAYFLGAQVVDAPTVYTVYGPLRIAVDGRAPRQLRGRSRVCAQEDVRRRRGCHWRLRVAPPPIIYAGVLPADLINLRIRYTGGINYTALGHAPNWETVHRWVIQSFGLPAGGLRSLQQRSNLAQVPIHFLLTAPPAFPLDASWESLNVRVLGWSLSF